VENEIGSLPFPDADMRIQIRQNEIAQTHWNLFCEAMDDDFNTARGIGILFDLVRTTNRLLDEYKDDAGSDSYATVMPLVSAILGMGRILGILGNSPQDFFHSRKTSAAENQTMDAQRIETLIREREDARKAKNYARADEIRKELEDQNILLEDRPDGTIWKIK
jgi:cysteinyl-tRNA synthetase